MLLLKRVYEPPSARDGRRILVDRLWPRGVSKEAAAIHEWAKDLAPSTELRKWFRHDPKRWAEFKRRYRQELQQRNELVQALASQAARGRITLVYGARDTEHNDAVALAEVIRELVTGTAAGARR
jgi:uncharacterized protein YeaO (DUF488 family)